MFRDWARPGRTLLQRDSAAFGASASMRSRSSTTGCTRAQSRSVRPVRGFLAGIQRVARAGNRRMPFSDPRSILPPYAYAWRFDSGAPDRLPARARVGSGSNHPCRPCRCEQGVPRIARVRSADPREGARGITTGFLRLDVDDLRRWPRHTRHGESKTVSVASMRARSMRERAPPDNQAGRLTQQQHHPLHWLLWRFPFQNSCVSRYVTSSESGRARRQRSNFRRHSPETRRNHRIVRGWCAVVPGNSVSTTDSPPRKSPRPARGHRAAPGAARHHPTAGAFSPRCFESPGSRPIQRLTVESTTACAICWYCPTTPRVATILFLGSAAARSHCPTIGATPRAVHRQRPADHRRREHCGVEGWLRCCLARAEPRNLRSAGGDRAARESARRATFADRRNPHACCGCRRTESIASAAWPSQSSEHDASTNRIPALPSLAAARPAGWPPPRCAQRSETGCPSR